jgi:predicted phage tail protein
MGMRVSKIACLSMVFGCVLGGSALAQAASSVKLSWSVPTTRENGQALSASQLTGYEVYYTTDDPAVTGSIKVSGGSTVSYTVPNLAAGNYHFAIAAVDSTGLKSKLSTIVDVKVAATSLAAPSVPTSTKVAVASTATTLKSLNVRWVPPKTRTDGTALTTTELSGYKISLRNFYVGSTVSATVSGGSVTNYAMSNIAKGLYVASVTAIDKNGKQSAGTVYYINI